ncbi:type III pantothenate kinase [Longimicrobium sp.]|uniref:type III pantothenate kinase n=1 Tax=Longimicrobium sp. TaxID=2029185 RepID=UPI002E2F5478|nr:type III pantothenate kinase [Longimicrobium sp.]HEX6040219.1 type III pantothenate kinase [Longimicrobium sp.]
MDLVFDVGNTETVIGWFADSELRGHWRVSTDGRRTADEYGLMLTQLLATAGAGGTPVRAATIGSVVPAMTLTLADACRRYLKVEAQAVGARTPLPITLDVEEPLTVGADRIVNTLAALRMFGVDTVVVDLGTATTFDCITRDGRFIGGVISPGVKTAASNLTERTAKLPRVELVPPQRVIGRRTEACIQSGVFYGAVDAIDGTVTRIREEWGLDDLLVVATGGLAELIGPYCRTVQKIEPFLTLYGLEFAREHLASAA